MNPEYGQMNQDEYQTNHQDDVLMNDEVLLSNHKDDHDQDPRDDEDHIDQ